MDRFPNLPAPQGPKVIEGAAKGALWGALLTALWRGLHTGTDDYKKRWRGL